MDPLFQDERISAYLDGELPPDERSQFEDELARNGELRQAVEELRTLHDSLQALPRHRLNDDFAQQVLRRAERAMLSDAHAGANGADGSAVEGSNVVRGIADQRIADRANSDARNSRRPWIWAAVAIAAAIALMVFNPPAKKQIEIAQSDSTVRSHIPARDNADGLPAERKALAPQADGERRLSKRGNEMSAKAKLPEEQPPALAARRSPETDTTIPKETKTPPQSTPGENFRGGALGSLRDLDGGAATKSDGRIAGGAAVPPVGVKLGEQDVRAADAPADAPAANLPADRPSLFAGSADHVASAKGAAADARQFSDSAHGPANGVVGPGRPLAARPFSYVTGEHGRPGLPAGGTIVAEIATTAAVSPETLQRLLDKRGITLNNSPAANLALLSAVRGTAADDSESASASSASTPAATAEAGGRPNLASKNSDQPNSAAQLQGPAPKPMFADRSPQTPAAEEEPLEVVYVVGTREQVMGLVDDFREQPAQYRTVAVTAVPPPMGDWREKDVKTDESRPALDDKVADGAVDKKGGQERAGADRELPQAAAPAAPIQSPPAATALNERFSEKSDLNPAPGARAGGSGGFAPPTAKQEAAKQETAKLPQVNQPGASHAAGAEPIVAEQRPAQKAGRPESPAAEPAIPEMVADSESVGEPTDRPSGLGWAARMTSLPPETEHVLRRSLAERENRSTNRNRQLDLEKQQVASEGHAELKRDKDADKAKSDGQSKQQGGRQEGLAWLDAGVAGEQMQAVFVFRLTSKQPNPIGASSPAALPASPAAKAK
jgi:anti-sigma factor RsiW